MNSLSTLKISNPLSKIRHYAEGGEVSSLEDNVSEAGDSTDSGSASQVLQGTNAINLPSAQNAKPMSVDDKGVVTFDNGVMHFPDGHIEQKTSDGSRWFKANPYAKMMRLPGKDPNQILIEKAAAKGIRSENYKTPEEFQQAAKSALGGTTEEDAQAIANGVKTGAIPPTLQGLFRARARVASILSKSGYDLTKANLDYMATQRYIGAQNSPAFQKQRSSLDFTESALDKVDQLAEQWKAGGFKLLNRARLVAAQNGALGPEAAKIATQLTGQINDMVASTSQVYMGGGTPTDQAMKIAGSNLSGDWSEPVLRAMTKQLRDNIQIRRNSLNHIPIVGAQGAMTPQGQPSPSPTATPQPQAQSTAPQSGVDIHGQMRAWALRHPQDPQAQEILKAQQSTIPNAGQPTPAPIAER